MTFKEAKASGRRARPLGNSSGFYDLSDVQGLVFTINQFLGDWELEPEEVRVWTPTNNEYHSYVFPAARRGILTDCYDSDSSDDEYLVQQYASFETASEALQVASFQRVQRKLLALAKALNGEWKADWSHEGGKFFIYYDHGVGRLTHCETWSTSAGEVFFKSVEAAQKALSSLTEEEKQVLIRGMQ